MIKFCNYVVLVGIMYMVIEIYSLDGVCSLFVCFFFCGDCVFYL